jgi:hypothetical protein
LGVDEEGCALWKCEYPGKTCAAGLIVNVIENLIEPECSEVTCCEEVTTTTTTSTTPITTTTTTTTTTPTPGPGSSTPTTTITTTPTTTTTTSTTTTTTSTTTTPPTTTTPQPTTTTPIPPCSHCISPVTGEHKQIGELWSIGCKSYKCVRNFVNQEYKCTSETQEIPCDNKLTCKKDEFKLVRDGCSALLESEEVCCENDCEYCQPCEIPDVNEYGHCPIANTPEYNPICEKLVVKTFAALTESKNGLCCPCEWDVVKKEQPEAEKVTCGPCEEERIAVDQCGWECVVCVPKEVPTCPSCYTLKEQNKGQCDYICEAPGKKMSRRKNSNR